MRNIVGTISNISNNTLNINSSNTLYISKTDTYEQTISIVDPSINSIFVEATVYLSNSNTGFKYKLNTTYVDSTSFNFITEPRTTESADIDEIEIVVVYEDVEFRSKNYIAVNYVNSSAIVMKFTSGTTLLNSSNMLYPRIRIGFPKWGTIEKNSISNGSKLLEPLFTPFYDVYSKVIAFNLHTKYKKPYRKVLNIPIGYNPSEIFRKLTGGYEKLYECSSTQLLPSRVSTKPVSSSSTTARLILMSSIDVDYDFLFLTNTRIYCRKLTNTLVQDILTIKGLDKLGNRLEERVVVLEDFYTCAVHKFSKIFSITCSSDVIVSNYVDCRFNHFIVRDINTAPPIVASDLFAFSPNCVKFANNEMDRDTLQIFNTTYFLSEPQYKFDLEHTGRITSVYVDEFLKLYWTDSSNKLYTNCINHDLSKDVGKHPSNNNNNIVVVSDTSTAISDWVDVSIVLSEWPDNTSMIIKVENNGTTLYYDQTTETFVEGIRYFYPPANLDILELSARVVNDSPYIFTVFDDKLERQYTASTQTQYLKSIQDPIDISGALMLIDDKLLLTDNVVSTSSYPTQSDKILLTLTSKELSMLDWELSILGMVISKTNTTMPNEYYRIISNASNDNPLIIEIDRMPIIKDYNLDRVLVDFKFRFDPMYNRGISSNVELQLVDRYGLRDKDLIITASDEYLTIPIDFTRNTKDINYVAD